MSWRFRLSFQRWPRKLGHISQFMLILPPCVALLSWVLVYLSCGTMGNKLGTLSACNFNLTPADAGACYCGAHQVPVLIHSIGLNCGPDEILHKLCTQVLYENLNKSRSQATEKHNYLDYRSHITLNKDMFLFLMWSFITIAWQCHREPSYLALVSSVEVLSTAAKMQNISSYFIVSHLLCTEGFCLFPGSFKIFILPNVSLERDTFIISTPKWCGCTGFITMCHTGYTNSLKNQELCSYPNAELLWNRI